MKFHCPSCNQKLTADDAMAGISIQCPSCNTKVSIPDPFEEIAGSDGSPSSSEGSVTSSGGFGGGGRGDFTDVSGLYTFLIGLAISVVFYLALAPIKDVYFGALFWKRGIIPFIEVILFFWSVTILVWKLQKLRKQQRGMLYDLLPEEVSPEITGENVHKFIEEVRQVPIKPTESFLVNRVARGLEYFQVRNNNGEVSSLMSTQSDIDANTVDASYRLVNVFIWAIPILGFIGTVYGLGAAVGGFASGLDQATDISVVKDSLNQITGGLATAFDTTFIALIMALLLSIPKSSIQKKEDELLNDIDEYCNENLILRLNDFGGKQAEDGAVTAENFRDQLRQGIDAAMSRHHAELRANFEKLEQIGSVLKNHAVDGWKQAQDEWQERRNEDMKHVSKAVSDIVDKQLQSLKNTEESFEQVSATSDRAVEEIEQLSGCIEKMNIHLSSMEKAIGGLNSVLEKLGEKQVVVEGQAPRKKKWGIFG